MITAGQLAAAYNVPGVIDYGESRGRGLLLATGAGLMMASMDEVTSCRWAVDLGGGRGSKTDLVSWLEACSYVTTHLVVCAWFTVTDPARFAANLAGYPPGRVVTYSQPGPLGYGVECVSMSDLAAVSDRIGLAC